MQPARFLVCVCVCCVVAFHGAAQDEKKAKTESTEGKIKTLTLDKDEMVIVGKKDSRDHKFAVRTSAKVRVNDRDGKLADLKVGDEVRVTWRSEGDRKVVLAITTLRKQQ